MSWKVIVLFPSVINSFQHEEQHSCTDYNDIVRSDAKERRIGSPMISTSNLPQEGKYFYDSANVTTVSA